MFCLPSLYQGSNFYVARAQEMAPILLEREEEVGNQLKAAFAQVGNFLLFSLHVYFGWFLEDSLMQLMDR